MTSPKAPASLLAHRILRAASSPDATVAQLAPLAEFDPAFAMRVLRVVNSAAFGLRQKVMSVRQACTLIGVRGLRSVALSLLVSDMAPVGRDGATVLAQVLRRAAAGGIVAPRCGIPTDDGFLVGLLLEVGMLSTLRDDPRTAAVVRMPASERIAFEHAAGMRAHTEIGAELVRSFDLPTALADAVAGHHDSTPGADPYARAAWAAERIAAAWECGAHEDAVAVAMASLRALGFDGPDAELALERLPALVADTAAAFGLVMETPQQLESLRRDATHALVELNAEYVVAARRLEVLQRERDELAAELGRANAAFAELAAATDSTTASTRRAG
jgi:HD-like signal output (HDOD) protein